MYTGVHSYLVFTYPPSCLPPSTCPSCTLAVHCCHAMMWHVRQAFPTCPQCPRRIRSPAGPG